MGRKSTVDRMPVEVREKLNELLQNPGYTRAEIIKWINEFLIDLGHDPVMTPRILDWHAKKIKRVREKLQQSRELAHIWIASVGSQPAGEVGHLLNEIVRSLAFETALSLSSETDPIDPKVIRDLAGAIEKLERASNENEKRAEIVRKAAREEAAETAVKAAKAGGVSPLTIERIRREVLGMTADNQVPLTPG